MIKLRLPQRSVWLIVGILIFSSAVVFLGLRGKRIWEDIATSQFNQQQLAIARSIARGLQNYFAFLKKYLAIVSQFKQNSLSQSPISAQPEIQGLPVIKITIINPAGQKTVITSKEVYTEPHLTKRDLIYLSLINKRQKNYISDTYLLSPNTNPRIWVADIVYAYAQTAFVWTIDVLKICEKATADIRSGETGYAWIINKKGHFLAHYEKSFIGENAFVARAQRNPAISFSRINLLQKQYLLTGKEGMSWYVSGWHRQRVGLIKKLIAYTPIYYAGSEDKGKFWAVAVVAPIDEVKNIVHQAVFYQWGLTFTALLIILGTGGYIFYQKHNYARELEEEITRKTEELEQTHQELIRSERLAAMGTAVAHVAHEIKNPLIVIGGFANQLLRSFEKDEKVKKKLGIIVKEASHLEGFLKDIGHFAKDITPQKETVDLNQLIEEIIVFVEPELVNRKISLKTYLTPLSPFIHADPVQIKQVLLNLIKNAVEAMPEGGQLTIRTYKNNEGIIEISDTGKGIPKEILDKIFNPFFTTKKDGTGLGLSICHKIVTAHRGKIQVESEVDRGTTVTIILPLTVNKEN
ncbi:MAG: ATP-binding protein [Candidatus Desulfofervidaceae bacterium]|nr:ATP-binding protein [Candidatus Desulfofervidaceae bacterium]